jgi:L-ascorbate metabolism protein UlaG (beta-lactamase superfamily)
VTRRNLLSAGTASVVVGAAATAGFGAPAEAAPAEAAPAGTVTAASRWHGDPGTSGVTLRWLGNNAWEINFGTTRILIDPWLTRFRTGTYSTGTRPDTPLTVDPAKIDPHVDRADLILVCHGHFDHLTDVPYIATRTGATVLGTESHLNLLRALGAPDAQLSTVRGGEYVQYNGYTVQVFQSVHSMVGTRSQVPFPGTRPATVPSRPRIVAGNLLDIEGAVADLVEGGTLAYQITVGERFRILVLSSSNFIERELVGVRPDLALIPTGGRSVHDYAARLMRTLDRPTHVLPTHWDDFDLPLTDPAKDTGGMGSLRDAIGAASPQTRFVIVDHLQSFTP